jgi:hypothetical protein
MCIMRLGRSVRGKTKSRDAVKSLLFTTSGRVSFETVVGAVLDWFDLAIGKVSNLSFQNCI